MEDHREIKIVNVKDHSGGIERAIMYIHDKRGSREDYDFYHDLVLWTVVAIVMGGMIRPVPES